MGYDIAHGWIPNKVEIVKRRVEGTSEVAYGVRFVLNSDRTKKIFIPPQETTIALETVEPKYGSHTITFWAKPEDVDILQGLFDYASKGLEVAFNQAYPS